MKNKFIENNIMLNVELYIDKDLFCAYISDNTGGSGIEVSGSTPQELANNLSPYIADYFYKNDDY